MKGVETHDRKYVASPDQLDGSAAADRAVGRRQVLRARERERARARELQQQSVCVFNRQLYANKGDLNGSCLPHARTHARTWERLAG
eukprot:SAG22_NODE_1391_length_4517_cov_30.127166_2_plen_87_part_00